MKTNNLILLGVLFFSTLQAMEKDGCFDGSREISKKSDTVEVANIIGGRIAEAIRSGIQDKLDYEARLNGLSSKLEALLVEFAAIRVAIIRDAEQKRAEQDALRRELAANQQEIQGQANQIQQQGHRSAEHFRIVEEHGRVITVLPEQMQARQTEIAAHNVTLAAHTASIAAFQNALQVQGDQIQQQGNRSADHFRIVEEHGRAIAALPVQMQACQNEIAAHNATLAAHTASIAALQNGLNQLNAKLAAHIANYEGSKKGLNTLWENYKLLSNSHDAHTKKLAENQASIKRLFECKEDVYVDHQS